MISEYVVYIYVLDKILFILNYSFYYTMKLIDNIREFSPLIIVY